MLRLEVNLNHPSYLQVAKGTSERVHPGFKNDAKTQVNRILKAAFARSQSTVPLSTTHLG